jgi:hypothetical protein
MAFTWMTCALTARAPTSGAGLLTVNAAKPSPHFLRKYDQMLVAFEAQASDEDIAALAETRTSRAFMLLGRVTGPFD